MNTDTQSKEPKTSQAFTKSDYSILLIMVFEGQLNRPNKKMVDRHEHIIILY
jgi:hypothetical protein